jgi:hypothetical protein
MPTEGAELDDHPLLARWLQALVARLLRRPWLTLAGVAISLVVSLAVTTRLEYRASRLDLLNRDSEFNKRWLAYLEEFGDVDDAVAVVEGADKSLVEIAVRDLAAQLADSPEFASIYFENDFSAIEAKALHLAPIEDVARLESFANRFAPLIDGDWRPIQIEAMLQQPARAPAGHAARGQDAAPLLASLASALRGETYRSPWPALGRRGDRPPSGLLSANDGRLAFLLVRLNDNPIEDIAPGDAIDLLRDAIADVQARHDGVRIGLTGMPVLENDEMHTSQADTALANVLGLFGVTALFAAGFGGLRHPMLALVVLLAAFGWSFAYITLSIGHLNILSMAFGAILIGLGIDFGIYYIASYLQFRADERLPSGLALVHAAGAVGPGIVTGAVTTSLAFFTAGLTQFTGVAELGIVAGGGILL